MAELGQRLIESLLQLSPLTIYLLVAVLCWAEAAFFLGFITPGELAVAVGGILASRGQIQPGPLIVIVVIGTLLGNSTGYYLGRRWGGGMLEWGPLQRFFGGAIANAQDFMLRRGAWAIVLGRLATPTRIAVPFLAGASSMPYRRFLVFDVPASLAWATAWVGLGYLLGESWGILEDVAGTAALLVLVLFVTALVIRWIATRVAANQRRIQRGFRRILVSTGTQGVARRLGPAFGWLGRRLDPRLARGLNLTLAFGALVVGVGAVGLVLSQTRAVRGLALLDFPVLEWMATVRTDDAVALSRTVLEAFRWPGVVGLALPVALLVGWRSGWTAALRVAVGVVGAGGGSYLLDAFVLEANVPRAEFPSGSVAVAAALLVHATAVVARTAGWGPSVFTAAGGVFAVFVVALGTLVAGWAAPSGIVLGLALGVGWATALELPRTLTGEPDAPDAPAPPESSSASPSATSPSATEPSTEPQTGP